MKNVINAIKSLFEEKTIAVKHDHPMFKGCPGLEFRDECDDSFLARMHEMREKFGAQSKSMDL